MRLKEKRSLAEIRAVFFVFLLACVILFDVIASSLQDELTGVLSDGLLEGADVALHVAGVEDGEVLFSKKADQPFIPASNQKILTAVAALDVLGADYEFVTTLWMNGAMGRGGVLHGDLLLVGGGDPTLGSPAIGEDATAQFDLWARHLLNEHGVRSISGDIIIDESMFDAEYVHPDWPLNQLSRHYSAPVNALVYHDNCLRLIVRPGPAVGEPARVVVYPDMSFLHIDNTCRTVSDNNLIRVDRAPGEWRIRVRGEVRDGTGGWSGLVSAPDPALCAGQAFANVLRHHGIEFDGEVRKQSAGEPGERDGMLLIARRRASLRKVLEVMLVESQNLYAESVLKTMGARRKGEGTWQNGAAAAAAALQARGAVRGDFVVSDGSGYSRNNRVTARLICDLLIRMYDDSGPEALKMLLPAAGSRGTLAGRLTGSAYAGKVHAKSGYISRVGTLSGYVRADSGRLFVFSIMINNFRRGGNSDMRRIQDAVVKAIIDADL